jgi:hypothetical protein
VDAAPRAYIVLGTGMWGVKFWVNSVQVIERGGGSEDYGGFDDYAAKVEAARAKRKRAADDIDQNGFEAKRTRAADEADDDSG